MSGTNSVVCHHNDHFHLYMFIKCNGVRIHAVHHLQGMPGRRPLSCCRAPYEGKGVHDSALLLPERAGRQLQRRQGGREGGAALRGCFRARAGRAALARGRPLKQLPGRDARRLCPRLLQCAIRQHVYTRAAPHGDICCYGSSGRADMMQHSEEASAALLGSSH